MAKCPVCGGVDKRDRCPKCNSVQIYTRKRDGKQVCRKCGKVFGG